MTPDSVKRVVITGMGMVSPLGLSVKEGWENIVAGRSGITRITLFDPSQHDTKIAGEVKGFDPLNYMGRKEAHRMDRFAQFAIAASREALMQSGLKLEDDGGEQIGVIIGSGIGGLTTLYEQSKVEISSGPKNVSPFLVPMMIGDMAASQVSICLGLRGLNLCVTTACSSGSDAIGIAFEIIRHGGAKAIIAGGSEAIINSLGIAAFNALRALSTRNDAPEKASCPFDAQRDGFVIGEGAGSIILEEHDCARSRGANILAEIIGYGATADAFHITQPSENGEGAARAMKKALAESGLSINDIDYINAHGTSTPINDRTETLAIKNVFGARAYQIPISSTKSVMGHLIGAAAAVESIVCIKAMEEGVLPPTINQTHPDSDCDLDYVPNTARKKKVSAVLKNSFGFGGHNSVLVFKRYSEA